VNKVWLIQKAYAQQATKGLNESFGGISETLRSVLDGIWETTKALDYIGCLIQGFFIGYEQIGGC
jgi:hypothetical protein